MNEFLEVSLLCCIFRDLDWLVPDCGEKGTHADVAGGMSSSFCWVHSLGGYFPVGCGLFAGPGACTQVPLGASTIPGSGMKGRCVSGQLFSCRMWGLLS